MATFEEINHLSLRRAAEAYMEMGFSLIPLAPESKSAEVSPGWASEKFRCSPDHWDYFLRDNMGMHLGRSRMLVLDIDSLDNCMTCFTAITSELLGKSCVVEPFWKLRTAGIRSGKKGSAKRVFRIPPDCPELEPKKISWVSEEGKSECIFELRCGSQQDVLPPSLHPDTRKPYQWIKHPEAPAIEILDAPKDLIYLWVHWQDFKETMEKANPNYVPPKVTKKMKKSGKVYQGTNYIEMWKNQQNLSSWLEQCGYQRKTATRYLSPNSHSGIPGILIGNGGTTFYSFGESDRFADNHCHDVYDLLVEFEFCGDRRAAWEYILKELGVETYGERIEKQIRDKQGNDPWHGRI